MSRFVHRVLDIYIRRYLRNHPTQIKKIEELDRPPGSFLVMSSTALGDTLLSTPAIRSLRKSFPKAKITAFMHKSTAPLFRDFSYIDGIILYHGGYRKFLSTADELRESRPDVAVILHGNGPQDIAFSILSGAKFILKHPTKSTYKKYLSYEFDQKFQHTIEDRLDIVRKLGGAVIETSMEIPPLNDYRKKAKADGLIEHGYSVIGFQLGAADAHKIWPVERFTTLAGMILQRDAGTRILVTGTAGEGALARDLVGAFGDRIINSCGKLGIDELPYLIRRMNLLVTNDTGTMHLAIALGVPTISLFSATDRNITGPYQDLEIHRVIQKDGSFIQQLPKKKRDNSAMKLISVDEVFAAYENLVHN